MQQKISILTIAGAMLSGALLAVVGAFATYADIINGWQTAKVMGETAAMLGAVAALMLLIIPSIKIMPEVKDYRGLLGGAFWFFLVYIVMAAILSYFTQYGEQLSGLEDARKTVSQAETDATTARTRAGAARASAEKIATAQSIAALQDEVMQRKGEKAGLIGAARSKGVGATIETDDAVCELITKCKNARAELRNLSVQLGQAEEKSRLLKIANDEDAKVREAETKGQNAKIKGGFKEPSPPARLLAQLMRWEDATGELVLAGIRMLFLVGITLILSPITVIGIKLIVFSLNGIGERWTTKDEESIENSVGQNGGNKLKKRVADKVAIIKKMQTDIRKHPDKFINVSVAELARRYGIPRSTFSGWYDEALNGKTFKEERRPDGSVQLKIGSTRT